MTATMTPTAEELSRALVETVAKVVTENGDAAAARLALADVLRTQGAIPTNSQASDSSTPGVAAAPVTNKFLDADGPFLRPNGVEYLPRKLHDHLDVAAVRAAQQAGIPILAVGPPGTGKSALAEASYYDKEAEERDGRPSFYTVLGSSDTEVSDFVGAYVQTPEGLFEWVDGPLLCAMEEGKPLIVDEIGVIDTRTLVGLYSAMDDRQEVFVTANPSRGIVKAKPGFTVFAATNPKAPGVRLSSALLSRFKMVLEIESDWTLARNLGVPAKFVSAAQSLDRKRQKGEIRWSGFQIREMLAFKELAEVFGEMVALRNAVNQAPEEDRATVSDVLSRAWGKSVIGLDLS